MKLFAILLSLILTTKCMAQLPLCYVYTITNSAAISEKGKTRILQQGSLIFENDIITVKGSGTLTLLDHKNKFIAIDQPGNYRYENLQKSLNVKPTGIADKYFHFIWEDLFKPLTTKSSASSKVIGGVIAGSKRGSCLYTMVEPIDHSQLDDDTIQFRWGRVPHANSYRFILKDSENNEFINIIIKDTSVAILKRNLLREEATSYYWNIATGDQEVSDCKIFITVVSAPEKQAAVDRLISGIEKDNDGFLYYLKISESLAKNGWYKEAAAYYLQGRSSLMKTKKADNK